MEKLYTKEEILQELEECDHLDDAKMVFSEGIKECTTFMPDSNTTSCTKCIFCGGEYHIHPQPEIVCFECDNCGSARSSFGCIICGSM